MSDSGLQNSSSTVPDGTSLRGSVTFCITELDPGGAEKALVRFALGLRGLGWSVKVVSLRDAGVLSADLESGGVSVTALGCGGFLDVRAVFRLRQILKQQSPDVLVCFLHQANIVGRLAAWLAGIRQVVSGIRVADRRPSVVWTDRLTRGLTQRYMAVSRHVADVHAELCRIPADQMTVIYNGVDLPAVDSAEDDCGDDSFRLLFVGRLTEQKRPQDLVAAVAALPAEIRQRILVDIVGDGELRPDLEKQIASTGCEDLIRLHGYQSDIGERMFRADVLVLPSAWEGLPNVVLEAMAHRLPVIATNVDGVGEVLEHEGTGWLVPSRDVPALTETIRHVSADSEQRAQVADRAFEAVQQRFCWGSAIQACDRLLYELIADDSGVKKGC